MFEELNRELLEIRAKLRLRQKVSGDLDRTQTMLAEQVSNLGRLESTLKKEGADVKKLEGLSLTGLFHSVLGDKQTQLEKERQEYLAAKLKYDECKYSISALKSDVKSFKIRITSLGELDEKYKVLIEKKERLISQSDSQKAAKLIELSESLSDMQSEVLELNEAIEAGRAALSGLHRVISSLKSARNWGTFDILGGGLISTAVKHSRINDARESIHEVQQQLRIFQRELADVGLKSNVTIDIGSFATFADYVFDGLIVDWIVQSKIGKSLESAVHISEKTGLVLMKLQDNLRIIKEQREELEQKRQKLIEQAE